MSRYQTIWDELKHKGTVIIAVAKPLQPRVIKAVINLKYYDDFYKFELMQQNKVAKIQYKKSGAQVVFKLITSLTTKGISSGDL